MDVARTVSENVRVRFPESKSRSKPRRSGLVSSTLRLDIGVASSGVVPRTGFPLVSNTEASSMVK